MPVKVPEWRSAADELRAVQPARKQLRILQVVEATSAGVGRHVADLCAALLRRGHELHLAYSPLRMEEPFACDIAALPNLHTYALPMRRAPSVSDIGAILKLRRYIRANGPFDVIHGHSSKGGAIARLSAAGLCSARVYTSHALRSMDPDLSQCERLLFETAERMLGRWVTKSFIAVSQEELREAHRLRIAADRTRLIPYGIQTPAMPNRVAMRAKYNLQNTDVCVIWIGRLVPQKAPERFVRLFARVLECTSGTRGLMIGSGPLEGCVRDLIRDLQLAKHLRLLQDPCAAMSLPAADVCAITSRYEGLPYVVLEAQSAGLPVVGFDVGGLSTIVENGTTGLIVAQNDESSFCNALSRLISDSGLRHQLSDAARVRSEQFGLERMLVQIEALYQQVSAGSSGGSALAA